MNAVLVPFAMVRCFLTLGGGSASQQWRRARRPWRRARRPAHIIPLLLGLAGVLLALSPTAAQAGDPIAWGNQFYGQCTVPEAAQSGVLAIAAGWYHSLALTEAGEVIAWGDDSHKQVTDAPGGAGFTAIAGGGDHGLALTSAGEVIAWGDDSQGQVTDAPGGTGFTAIAAGLAHSLALTDEGKVIAWGWDPYGQVGNAPTDAGFTAIAAGGYHGLALTGDAKVIAWGWDDDGQVSNAPTGTGFTAIAAGGYHSLALTEAGQVIAWGRNGYGQCNVPTAAESGVLAIAAGWQHSLALTDEGKVIAWGRDSDHQCDVPTAAESGVIAIAGGGLHSLALLALQTDFWGSPTSGPAPLTVQFTDRSTNNPTAWQWDFGDGGASSEQNPSHTYLLGGGYTPSLTATNADGFDTETKAGYIRVTAVPPVADFFGNPSSGPVPLTVYFTDLSSNSPIWWSWNFGDTGTSSLQHPSHDYTSTGQFTVSLTAANAASADTETKTDYISVVMPPPPVADFFGTPTSGTVPLTVQFIDLSTGEVTSRQWDFGDGGASTERSPSYTYLLAGIYTPSMTASNAFGSDSVTKTRYIVVNFADVGEENWAYDEIMACAEADIITGYLDGSYQPGGPVDRAEMAAYISRALAGGDENVPQPAQDPVFTDVDETHWAYKYICYAVEQNVVRGYAGGDYQPAAIVTRDQMAVYIARALVAPAGEAALADYVPAAPRNFPDVLDTGYGEDGTESHWAYRHVEYCVEHGVVEGYGDGLYHPEETVTRDQMAVYIARAFWLIH